MPGFDPSVRTMMALIIIISQERVGVIISDDLTFSEHRKAAVGSSDMREG